MRIDKLFFSAILASTLFSSPLAAGNGPGYGVCDCGTLTMEEESDLLFMREEEKLARDVYITLFEKWGTGIFDNISRSEQRHMDAIAALLERHGLEDPVVDEGPDGIGEFLDGDLAELYEALVAAGTESDLVTALHVGALIEEVDIEDLAKAIERSDNPGIRDTYESLLCGSRNHLRGFARQIEWATATAYEPQWEPEDDELAEDWHERLFDIIDSPMERCGIGRR